jgi:hypothetical protein
MGWWSDLRVTMRTRRGDRIDPAEADRLLAGQSTGTARAGLVALLSEASGPARATELANEPAAVERFRLVRSAAPPEPALSTVDNVAGRPWYRSSLLRRSVLRLAIAVLLLAAAGTVTVTLGYRPARMQPPSREASSAPPATPSGSPSSPQAERPRSVLPSRSAAGTAQSDPLASRTNDLTTAVQLCRVWAAAENDKATRDQVAAALKPLIAATDGPNGVPAFCRKLLDEQTVQPTTPGAAAAAGTGKTSTTDKTAAAGKADAMATRPAPTRSPKTNTG